MLSNYEKGALQSVLWGSIPLIIIFVFYALDKFEPDMPKGITWIGRRKERLSYLRAKVRTGLDIESVLREANEHHKHGRAVAFAHLIGAPQVILPPSLLHWMITQPESVISQDAQANAVHDFIGSGLSGDNTAPEILRKKLARDLEEKIPVLNDEICAALDDIWGQSEDWKSVDLRDDIRMLNARVANRILVGKSLCRDPEYLQSVLGFPMMHRQVSLFWHVLHHTMASVVSVFVARLTKRYTRMCAHALRPVLAQRVTDVLASKEGNGTSPAPPLPNDLLTWLVERFIHRGEDMSNLEWTVAPHILTVNIAAVDVTTFALLQAVIDLLNNGKYVGPVVAEADTVLAACNFHPEKQDVLLMTNIEKALKETLRKEVQIGFMRQVVAPQGLHLEDGTFLPHGTRVCISTLGVHYNDDNFPNAGEWNPEREPVESLPAGGGQADGNSVTSMTRATETYLAFGLGRRACPGRFLVSHQLKVTMAQIFSRYEIKTWKGEKDKKRVTYVRRRKGVKAQESVV